MIAEGIVYSESRATNKVSRKGRYERTLPTIPDLLIIYVKPNSGNYTTYGSGLTGAAGSALNADYTQGDWYYSMGNWNLNVGGSYINGKPLNVNFKLLKLWCLIKHCLDILVN